MITGNDELSLKILDSLKSGTKVKDIPDLFHVSLDQAKRLSRYSKMLARAEIYLSEESLEKLKQTGLKSLALNPLFKSEDWEGLTEILTAITENTKRSDLPLLIQALEEKRKRIHDFQREIDFKISSLERQEKELQDLEKNIIETQKKIEEETVFLNKYPENVRSFLVECLGIYKNKLVLSKRLDSRWQKNLKKKGILTYSGWEYVWYVNELDGLVADYLNRINRKKPLATEWDYDKEFKRYGSDASLSPYYKLPSGLAVDLRSSMQEVKEKMQEIEEKRKVIQYEMKQLKKTSPKSFIEAIEAKNTLSANDLKRHGELQDKALKWLYNRECIVASEITLPNGKRADVIGYDESGHIIIVEVKVSMNDFVQDEKWETYLNYCDEFYFLLSKEARPVYFQKKFNGIGLLQETKNSLKISVQHTIEHTGELREKVCFSINKALAKKYVYGY